MASFRGSPRAVEKALVKDLVPENQRGRAYGAYNFIVGITALPAGLLTGAVWRTGGPSMALEVGAVLASLAGILVFGWDHWRRTTATADSVSLRN